MKLEYIVVIFVGYLTSCLDTKHGSSSSESKSTSKSKSNENKCAAQDTTSPDAMTDTTTHPAPGTIPDAMTDTTTSPATGTSVPTATTTNAVAMSTTTERETTSTGTTQLSTAPPKLTSPSPSEPDGQSAKDRQTATNIHSPDIGVPVGVSMAVVVLIAVVVALSVIIIRRRKRMSDNQDPPTSIDNVTYSITTDTVAQTPPSDIAGAPKLQQAGERHDYIDVIPDGQTVYDNAGGPVKRNVYDNVLIGEEVASGKADDDVIMVDNDVYAGRESPGENGGGNPGDRSIYAVAAGTTDDIDDVGLVMEENDAYGGNLQAANDGHDDVIFQDNDAYESAGNPKDDDDDVVFEDNDVYEHSARNP